MATTAHRRTTERLAALGSPLLFGRHVTAGRHLVLPHQIAIDQAVRAAIARGNGRLIISIPPQHGKSTAVSLYLPTWYLGTYPERHVMVLGYGSEFTRRWGGGARDLMDAHGMTLWGLRTKSDTRAKDEWGIEGHRGGMFAAGVGGPVTGRPADLIIVDDPIKTPAEAYSRVQRQNLWEWYQGAVRARARNQTTIILMMTRWHRDDLAGRLLASSTEDWQELRIPGIAEPGDLLGRGQVPCPMCSGTGRRTDTHGGGINDPCVACRGEGTVGDALWPGEHSVESLISRMVESPYWFSAHIQGKPKPVQGGMFNPKHRRRYTRTPDGHWMLDNGEIILDRQLLKFATVDLAASERTSADWTVLATWGYDAIRGSILLLDVDRHHQLTTRHKALLEESYARWGHGMIGIEAATYGLGLLAEVRASSIPTMPLPADTDKTTRALQAAALYDAGRVFHPHPEGHPWILDWEEELDDFPTGGHDDQVDTAGYMAVMLRRYAAASTPSMPAQSVAAGRTISM